MYTQQYNTIPDFIKYYSGTIKYIISYETIENNCAITLVPNFFF